MSDQYPRVTVIVPTHRRTATLAVLLEHLALQGYPHDRLDVIVVGDGTEEERDIIERAKSVEGMPPVRLLQPGEDPFGGRSASLKRNTGARAAQGEVLAFTDDDCLPSSGWVSAAVPHFRDEEVGGVEGRTMPKPVEKQTIHYRQTLHLGLAGGFPTCNMFYRRSVFEEVGGFDPALPFYKEDSDLGFSVLERGYLIPHEPEALVEHPTRAEAPWNVLNMAAKVIYDPLLYKKHPRLYRRSIGGPLSLSDRAYLLAAFAAALGAFTHPVWVAAGAALFALVLLRHLVRSFWGARFTARELVCHSLGLVLAPYVKLVQLARGNLRYRSFLWL